MNTNNGRCLCYLDPLPVSKPKQITNSVAQEPEGPSPHSQQPATGPYPEPAESNPHPSNQSP
jgi:hypothetical protein